MTGFVSSFDVDTVKALALFSVGALLLVAFVGATALHRARETDRMQASMEAQRSKRLPEEFQPMGRPMTNHVNVATQVLPHKFKTETGAITDTTGEHPAVITPPPPAPPPVPVLEIEAAVKADELRIRLEHVRVTNVALLAQCKAFALQSGLDPVVVALKTGPLSVSVLALRLDRSPSETLAIVSDMAMGDGSVKIESRAEPLDPTVRLT